MRIYLIRHGETDWNKKGLVQGRINNPLNKNGENQAFELSNKFKGLKINGLITSSLGRAKETINIIKNNNNWELKLIEDDNFIERDFGELEGKSVEEYRLVSDFTTIKGCERNETLERRVKSGIEKIINSYEQNDLILVASHSHVLKACLHLFSPKEYDYTHKLNNCEVLEIIIDNKKIKSIKISI